MPFVHIAFQQDSLYGSLDLKIKLWGGCVSRALICFFSCCSLEMCRTLQHNSSYPMYIKVIKRTSCRLWSTQLSEWKTLWREFDTSLIYFPILHETKDLCTAASKDKQLKSRPLHQRNCFHSTVLQFIIMMYTMYHSCECSS